MSDWRSVLLVRHLARRLLVSLFILPGFAFATAVTAVGQQADQPTITMDKIEFSPDTLIVPVGSTVTWQNGNLVHTVTSDDGSFDSGFLLDGQTYELSFDTPGTYPYYCVPHGGPGGVGMAGVIIVQPASS